LLEKIADMFSSDNRDDTSSEAANNARDGAARKVATWMRASFGRSVRQQASVEALPSIFLRLILLFSADMVDIKLCCCVNQRSFEMRQRAAR
jgi:hypothetical protein